MKSFPEHLGSGGGLTKREACKGELVTLSVSISPCRASSNVKPCSDTSRKFPALECRQSDPLLQVNA